MVRLVIEAPLADHEVRAAILDLHPAERGRSKPVISVVVERPSSGYLLDHGLEIVLLLLVELLVCLRASDVELMLSLGCR